MTMSRLACLALGAAGMAILAVPARAGSARPHIVLRHAFGPAAQTPYAGLVRGQAGRLYGTSYGGGAAGAGAVFELSPPGPGRGAWTETVIHGFARPGANDGAHPAAALILGAQGVLYGTTSTGGGPGNAGGGTVFALTPPALPWAGWTARTLFVFPRVNGAASAPAGRLLTDGSGALFGTTMAGGLGLGSVFRLTPPVSGGGNWTETTLHAFGSQPLDGATPLSGLVADGTGALYGTTAETAGRPGDGTLYRLTPPPAGQGAWSAQILFNFPANGAYGSRPDSDLTIDARGTLFGTTVGGGTRGNGAVFRMAPPAHAADPWHVSLLYSFTGHFGDAGPEGGVVFGPRGTLLGTTGGAVKYQHGAVFQLIPGTDAHQSWSEQIIARFPSVPRGFGLFPVGDLIPDGAGGFFGVTELGGKAGMGTVFEVTP
jgi:uncharacterized repeat protein (TIGR03803 family)